MRSELRCAWRVRVWTAYKRLHSFGLIRGGQKTKSRRGTDSLSDSLAARLASRKTRASPVALRHRLSTALL